MEGRTTSAQSSKGLALSSDSRRTQNSRFGHANRRQGGQASQKKFPAFQGPRSGNLVARGESVAPKAIAEEITASPELEQRFPVQNIHEPVDNEELLKEIDACGVGFIASLKNDHKHEIITQALTALGCMEHRGACSADDISGDGAGVMTKIPWALLKADCAALNETSCGVGMVFIPNDDAVEKKCREIYENVAKAEGFKVLAWRDVPIDISIVGPVAKKTMPRFRQILIESTQGLTGDALERELFIVRKLVEKEKAAAFDVETAFDFFTCSLSNRTIVYKARFWRTADDTIYVASEVGVLGDVLSNAKNIVAKGRLGPGQMVCADLEAGAFQENTAIAKDVASKAPYGDWIKASGRRLSEMNASQVLDSCQMAPADALKLQSAMGYGLEDQQMVIESMAMTGAEPTYCMGDDVPLPVLASTPHMLYDYFKQRFAQVTNPPIDPLREGLVMSLEMRLGRRGNLLQPGADAYNQIMLKTPVLLESELAAVQSDTILGSKTFELSYSAGSKGALKQALTDLCASVEAAVRAGCGCVVLSDRFASMDPSRPPISPLLGVGAVHHHLIRAGLRTETSLVVETAQCFSTHHVAMLVGYGAHAVCPYLAFESCRQWRAAPRTEALIKAGKVPDMTADAATINFKKSLEKGLLKILSKMGISLLSCYHGAQIFEAYGLGREVVDTAFVGSVSRIGGMSLDDIAAETEAFWAKGFPEKVPTKLDDYGFIQSRPKGEYHANNQTMAKLLHKAIGLGGKGKGAQEAFDAYTTHFEEAPVHVLRDMLELASPNGPISIDEVESPADIMARFCTGGMSLGAISRETHEAIAIAMNRIGGKSNSGEGGEDPVRWTRLADVDANGKSETLPHLNGLQNGDIATSRIKQVASGRFGVTPQFLVNAEQLEIKVAQGAKPGEGGQLPGKKVSPYIAGMRRSKPGVPLISPPPHHDIYSIEDLAQLIYDLHQVNKAAKVSVKLVAQAGIGTVASGVAKANADVIQISGHDGGTGASPISSIKHCGGPMEMGLAEVHQILTANGLRERVTLRVDGGMRTGRDVLVTAALGGDEFGFGTVAMIATGCIMARVCHTNNCPVGVASQREELRARFPGVPEDLVNYFHFVADEVRAGLAELGLRSMNDLIVHDNGPQLDDDILADAALQKAIETQGTVSREYDVVNVDRSALGRVSGAVAKLYGDSGFGGTIDIKLNGSAGQSFACFLVGGMKVHLNGEANDYVGKGMAGEAVVEGTGDHCCEYMTGGVIVALGPVGRNVAAGMTGGLGYFYDEEGDFPDLVNGEIVAVQRVETRAGEAQLKELIETHVARTGSAKGKAILADWSSAVEKFWQLVPPSEANSPQASKNADAAAAAGGNGAAAVPVTAAASAAKERQRSSKSINI
ncbi:hypothetical protein Ndes2526B_g08744 [Nannochloris sp. 'desiccata']